MIFGYATPEGTKQFTEKHDSVKSNFKLFADLYLSNVGIGTYLGDADSKTDLYVEDAVKESIRAGINVIDTAINYRSQKAERSVGKAISDLIEKKEITRDEIFICTKNGYVTNDADINQDFWSYVKEKYVQKGVVKQGDITSGYHCMTVPYLEDQLERSLTNLQLDCVDLMYIHNAAEGQLKDITKDEFIQKLKSVFELYEKKRKDGKIRFYGMATWECFRVPKDNPFYLSLSEIVKIAEDVGGQDNGFRFIQLPFNMYYDQAFLKKTQTIDDKDLSAIEAASKLGIGVFTSVPFMQGRLLSPGVMPEFGNLKPSLRALQFIRSTPGVISPLVGQKSPEHVSENLEIMKINPMSESELLDLVKKLTS
ncbi:MAG: aldo/keto reductase [Nitrosopumilaceae archaeon]|nr:aldo/keto reductase [Nitrosopumilaceae archaeon]